MIEINKALGTDLAPGKGWLSSVAHEHMYRDHEADYAHCFAHLDDTFGRPTYVGQAPKHGRNFELLRRYQLVDKPWMLIAVGLEPNKQGNYHVRSCYLVSDDDVQRRRNARRLTMIVY